MKTNVLLMGRVGTGKTHSLRTIPASGHSLRVISMEPGIADVLGDIQCSDGCHWVYIPPLDLDWKDVTRFIELMNKTGVGRLSDIADPNRSKYIQFLKIFSVCQSFICDRCGEDLGCVDNWPEDVVLAMDGLTGLCKLCMQTLCGAKPFVSQIEYKAGQEAVMNLMDMCLPRRCSFVLLAHTDREINETGTVTTTVSGIGQKLAPKLVKAFSEVVSAKREFSDRRMHFYWDTTQAGEETKVRRLPWGDRIPPDFRPLLEP